MNITIDTYIDPETLPEHTPDRFTNFYDHEWDGKKGFRLPDGNTYLFDGNGGWTDENGCYYETDGTPAGWFISGHYYDMNGNYVPNDEDPTKLPQHKYNAKPTKLDSWGCFTASDGCYYSQFGEPVGWVLTKPDGNQYFFDLDGTYIERDLHEKSDLIDFDLGDFIVNLQDKKQLLKQNQKKTPKQQMQMIPIPKKQQEQIKPQQAQPIIKPQQPIAVPINKQQQQPTKTQFTPSNKPTSYQFILPDNANDTAKQFIAHLKQNVAPIPQFMLNKEVINIKCGGSVEYLEQMEIMFGPNLVAVKK